MLLHVAGELVRVDGLAALLRELDGQLDREAVGRRQGERLLTGDRVAPRELLEDLEAARERLGEALLLVLAGSRGSRRARSVSSG